MNHPQQNSWAIRLERVSKSYGSVVVLQEVSLNIAPGETTILIGPSGSGKTTLLEMMNGLVTPDGGRVWIHGKPLEQYALVQLRRQMGYVIQEGGLFPHYTIYDNIALVPRLMRWEESRIRQRVEELVEMLHLPADRLQAYPHQLSGGQRQRVGVARALAADPQILLMDEPFGALDPIVREELQEQFRQLQRRLRKTVVFVTHDMDEAFRLGDRIALLHQSRLLQVGSPLALLLQPADPFVQQFVGRHRILSAVPLRTLIPFIEPAWAVLDSPMAPRQIGPHLQKSGRRWLVQKEGDQFALWEKQDNRAVRCLPIQCLEAEATLESALGFLFSGIKALLVLGEDRHPRAVVTLSDLLQAVQQLMRKSKKEPHGTSASTD